MFDTKFLGTPTLRTTSAFGFRILNGKKGFHKGLDIGIANAPLSAPFNGYVEVADKIEDESSPRLKKGYGRWIQLKCLLPEGIAYIRLAHLSKVNVNVGDNVVVGQSLGVTGSTGYSTGPHIHVEVIWKGTQVDPVPFLGGHTLTGVVNRLPTDFTKLSTSEKYTNQSGVTQELKTVDSSATEYRPTPEPYNSGQVGERLAPGIWRIVKLLLDDSIINKQVADSSISVQTGSLLNFFRKVCQEPWVEFFGDTYGDQFYFIVRKPPFDKEGITKMLDTVVPIVISTDDVISTNLTWNNAEIFSWYQLLPVGDFLVAKDLNLYMPAIYFPEYAAVWGSKPLSIQSNYYNFINSGRYNNDKSENANNQNAILSNAVADMRYMVESNAYNPFTRRGNIVINGTRKIKRGTFIMHTTGEIFHVDSVTNSYSVTNAGVSYFTSIQVSKGIYPEYVRGKMIDGKLYSYFNIIDFGDSDNGGSSVTKSNAKTDAITQDNWLTKMSSWKVDQDVFAFFLRKEQVSRSQNTTIY